MTSVYSSLKNLNEYSPVGYSDLTDKHIKDLSYIGGDEKLTSLKELGVEYAFVTVGSVGDPTIRKKIFKNAKKLGFILPSIIDKSACVDAKTIGENVFVGKNAVINAGTIVGDMAIINSGAIVEHDCNIGSFVHIAPGSTLCGGVIVGENSHIGAGSVVIQNIQIGKNCIIGAGSVVVKNIPDNSVAYGNPCKVVRKSGQ